jgi:hypothetical protein
MPDTRTTLRPLALAVLMLGLALGAAIDAVLLHHLMKRQHSWVAGVHAAQSADGTRRGAADCPERPYWGPYHSQHDPHHRRGIAPGISI